MDIFASDEAIAAIPTDRYSTTGGIVQLICTGTCHGQRWDRQYCLKENQRSGQDIEELEFKH
jgi:hypothetical protein